jgi:predicted AAA+ superfamily ATPase
MRDVLRQKLVDALAAQPPTLTRRDIRLPAFQNKALAVIGMRRSGKSTFLWQCLAERLAAGVPRDDLVYFSFEDDRLIGMQASDLAWLIEEYYPVDSGLIPVYERATRSNLGHALETAVLVELERRGYQIDYVRTPEGLEVDFLAQTAGQPPHLIPVCLDTSDPGTLSREVRALSAAAGAIPESSAWLVTLDPTPPQPALPAPLQWRSAADWLLESVEVN